MQHGAELLLLVLIEMDQQITTDDQIDTYKGRVLEHIMPGKQDTVAYLFAYAIVLAIFSKETEQPAIVPRSSAG